MSISVDQSRGPGSSDPVIDAFRWFVVLGHVVVLLFFKNTNTLMILRRGIEPFCWPYWQECWKIRFDTDQAVNILFTTYALLILISFLALVASQNRAFWISLLVLNVYLMMLVSLDYRFRANEFYMLFWLNAVFLLWPAKRWAIPLTLISFYFWAGTLKLNYEWLSGSVLYHDLYLIPPQFASWACTYVVVLEMTIVWFLLAERAWLRWMALAQFVLFHIESFSQIHWFYPILMATMLSWFVINWHASGDSRAVSITSLIRGRAPRSAYVLLAIFAAFQLAPYLYRGDKALTGQGRIFALHMFEARQACDVLARIHFKDKTSSTVNLLQPQLPPRMICDPVVYFNRINNLCRSYSSDPNFVDADFVMRARRATDTAMTTIIDEVDFCNQRPTYNVFSNNSWMR